MALWYHYDVYCGMEFSGHLDLKLDDKQSKAIKDELFKYGLDLVFNEKWNDFTKQQIIKYQED